MMARIAPKVDELVHLDDAQLRAAVRNTLANWSSIKQTITASGGGKVSKSPQGVKEHAGSGDISQNIAATDHGEVTESGQSIDLT